MANKKFVVELERDERARLIALISKGKAPAKVILKARILLKADQAEGGAGWLDEEIVTALDTNLTMVSRVRERLVTKGLDAVLMRKKRETPPVAPIPAFAGTSLRRRSTSQTDRTRLLRAAPRSCTLDDSSVG